MKIRLILLATASTLTMAVLALWAGTAQSASTSCGPTWRKDYVGSKVCATCHERKHEEWSQSLHSRMIQKAGPRSVLGDFSQNNRLEHEGQSFRGTRLNLATLYAVRGEYLRALQEYKNVLKLHPSSKWAVTAYYYLGVTYAQLGICDKSIQSFETTIAMKPDFRNARDLLRQVRGRVAIRR